MLLSRTFAYEAEDSEERRREKHAIFLLAGSCTVLGAVWALMYWFTFGSGLTALLPAGFTVIVGASMVVSHLTKNHRYAVYAQTVCIVYITALIQWSIGGVFESGFVLAWAFLGPISALFFFELRGSAIWFLLYLVNLAITILFDDTFEQYGEHVPETTRQVFFVLNLSMSSFVVLLFASYFVYSAATQRERADGLQHDLDEAQARRLGSYTLGTKLGQGGMGVVYRAKHTLLRRPTAIKLLMTEADKPEQLARFEREVQLTAELSHPNIVAVYDYGRSPEGEFYYAMEFLPGIDLESLIAEWGPMPPSRVVPILAQVCDALDEAHFRGLVHRDIKPANVLLSKIGKRLDVVKVVDFGLVREVEGASDLTADNHITGTPAYMSPESLTDPDNIGPASDLYAVGAVGFYLLTGERVFTGKTLAEVCAHHIHTEPRPPSLLCESRVPALLDEVLLRCLSKRPSDRYADAGAVRDALLEIEVPVFRDGADWWDSFEATDRSEPEEGPSRDPLLTVDVRRR